VTVLSRTRDKDIGEGRGERGEGKRVGEDRNKDKGGARGKERWERREKAREEERAKRGREH